MNTLIIIFTVITFLISFGKGSELLVLPYQKVPASVAAGDKISIPISNDKFIISYCASLGNSYLYTENNERTEYSPVAYFKDSSTLELYLPEVKDEPGKKYFIVVELPLAEAIIKTDAFAITKGKKINLPTTDGCGKNVRFSNKDNNIANNNGNNNNNTNKNDNNQNKVEDQSKILSAENTSNAATPEEPGSNNMVIIACAGTSVVALVVISGFVFIKRGKSYMKGDEDISYSSLNYMGNNMSPKPYNPVGGLYDNLTNSNDEFDRDYQLKCLNDVPSQVSYPVSLSDGNSGVNLDKTTDIFEPNEEVPLPELPITKHIVEEIVINPEKVISETAVSAVVTTASVALAINECGDLTIDNSNIAYGNETMENCNTTTTTSSGSCSTCTGSCSCTSCSTCTGSCSCSCTETTNNESSLKLLSLDFSLGGDTTRGYSVFVDNDKKDSVYTETNYDDSRRMTNYTETTGYDDSRRMTNYTETTGYDDSRRITNYTETTGYDDSRRMTNYTETTGYDDSRRMTNYTETTGYDDSRRMTNYTETTGYDDSRRMTNYTEYTDYTEDSRRNTNYTDFTEDSRRLTNYTDYTEGSSYTTDRDSRRFTNYTEGSSYTNRDSRYSEYTEGSSYSTCSCSGSECDCSNRNTYSEYTSYTTDSRRYTGSEYTDSRRQTYTTDFSSSQYSSDFCEAHDASESELPSKILPLSTIEPFNDSMSNGSFLDALQAKQSAIRESINDLLPTGPITGKPPKFDLEFVAQSNFETSKPGELPVKAMDVIRIVENLDGGYYMASNSTTGFSGKIPAHIISSLL